MTETSALTINVTEGVGEIVLNRPDIHNAFDDALIKLMIKAIGKLESSDQVKLIVLKANGKSFSAGADLNWMKRMADYSWSQNYQDSLGLATLMQNLAQTTKPTISLVQGSAFGGGVGLAACCDIVLASDRAKFCLSEVKLGLIPAVISPYVIKAIGQRQASRYFLTAELFDAMIAERIGLVHQVYPHDDFVTNCQAFIKSMLNNGPEAVKAAKKLIDHVHDKPIDEELIRETAQRISDIRASKEGKEGLSAFLEKRNPNWQKSQQED
ncbi:MAG: enoyl-CoA hydratase/isomerase family protein [Kangiellaceae bacterium]|jgi:methylglutaconyl-CoA hydratase|nr:enoyl-CoA hydratase/isomerase family protein [Kangiellaceae bacterium]